MMDFLPDNQLYKIDYEKLFFDCDDRSIWKLIHLHQSKELLGHYKTEIRNYHEKNLELIEQIKKELLSAIEQLS